MNIQFDIDALEEAAAYKGMDVTYYTSEKIEPHQNLYIFRRVATGELSYVWYPMDGDEPYVFELSDSNYDLVDAIRDCTVQTLSNYDGTEVSVGWWYDGDFQG